jgi:hypothetical protein
MSCAVKTPKVVDRGKRDPIRLVLLCSTTRSVALVGLVTQLALCGLDFDLVSGVDEDSDLAAMAVRHYGEGALYVVCRDEELDYYCSEHLQRVFEREGLRVDHFVVTITLREERIPTQSRMLSTRRRRLGDAGRLLAANDPA